MIAIAVPILILGRIPFKIMIILLSMASLYELVRAKGNKKETPLFIKIIAFLLIALVVYIIDDYDISCPIDYKIYTIIFGCLFLPIIFINNNDKYNISDALYLIGSILFLGIGFSCFIIVRNLDLSIFIYLILITIMTDTFALITGSLIGKHKLCEKISPHKTIEGAIGGSLIGTIIPTLFYTLIINSNANIFLVLGITFILTIIGQLGDLFFSSIKRNYDIKDFSRLIPGHGGILDRMDSILFVMIAYMLFINII